MTEKAPNNIFVICKCGYEVEAEGHIDFDVHPCPSCKSVGRWTPEQGCWEIPSFNVEEENG
jgi:hypothetical protein